VILKGKVYNVTKYLDYHPGGIPNDREIHLSKNSLFTVHCISGKEKLMLVAGKDATKYFG
jgi:cytochrome b involved in lipid metabolism